MKTCILQLNLIGDGFYLLLITYGISRMVTHSVYNILGEAVQGRLEILNTKLEGIHRLIYTSPMQVVL